MKGFLIAHNNRSSVAALSTPITGENDLITVLFQIECSVTQLADNLIFADISQFNESLPQGTILFDSILLFD